MLVEDEAIAAMAVSHLLESLGYIVVGTADTGRDAIELASASHPDVVIMDIRLKGEMSGIESAKVIRERLGVPVVFTTAYSTEEIRKQHQIDEGFQFVTKPIRKADLVRAISVACGTD
jgi:two-component system response regulator